MFTFSQLVDDLVSETKRPDLVSEISRFLNQTIRELHATPDRNATIFYEENFNEVSLTADTETGYTWEITNPTRFQKMAGVRFSSVYDSDGNPAWAELAATGPRMNHADWYYYRVGGTFVFSGYGGVDGVIDLGYYEFPRSLNYFASAARPATYDEDTGWTYHTDYNGTAELQETARGMVSNWLILRWNQIIAEGLRAKVYKRVSDDSRARTCYSLYQSLRQGLWTSETAQFYGG